MYKDMWLFPHCLAVRGGGGRGRHRVPALSLNVLNVLFSIRKQKPPNFLTFPKTCYPGAIWYDVSLFIKFRSSYLERQRFSHNFEFSSFKWNFWFHCTASWANLVVFGGFRKIIETKLEDLMWLPFGNLHAIPTLCATIRSCYGPQRKHFGRTMYPWSFVVITLTIMDLLERGGGREPGSGPKNPRQNRVKRIEECSHFRSTVYAWTTGYYSFWFYVSAIGRSLNVKRNRKAFCFSRHTSVRLILTNDYPVSSKNFELASQALVLSSTVL